MVPTPRRMESSSDEGTILMWQGVLCGIALGLVNGAAAWFTIRLTWGQSPAFFVKAFLGGMIVRLIAVAGVAILLFQFTEISKLAFTIALAITFLVVQVLEIAAIVRRRTREVADGGTGVVEQSGESG